MFENLTEKFEAFVKKVTGRGKLSEENIQDALKQVRLALLEADVNYKVVKAFVENIRQRAVGKEVLESLTPGQQLIKIVNEELIRLMGGAQSGLDIKGTPPHVIMLVGLQGSGKTTTAVKLAYLLRKQGRHILCQRMLRDLLQLNNYRSWGNRLISLYIQQRRIKVRKKFPFAPLMMVRPTIRMC
jgi:signal recognition particle subunit SRP54